MKRVHLAFQSLNSAVQQVDTKQAYSYICYIVICYSYEDNPLRG